MRLSLNFRLKLVTTSTRFVVRFRLEVKGWIKVSIKVRVRLRFVLQGLLNLGLGLDFWFGLEFSFQL